MRVQTSGEKRLMYQLPRPWFFTTTTGLLSRVAASLAKQLHPSQTVEHPALSCFLHVFHRRLKAFAPVSLWEPLFLRQHVTVDITAEEPLSVAPSQASWCEMSVNHQGYQVKNNSLPL
jgi:hypothetical protein